MATLDECHERFIPIVEGHIRRTGDRSDIISSIAFF